MELKLVFKPKETNDLSLLMDKKLDYILNKVDHYEKDELNDLQESVLAKFEKMIDAQTQSLEELKKVAASEEEKLNKFIHNFEASFEKKEQRINDLLKKFENNDFEKTQEKINGALEKFENPPILKKLDDMMNVYTEKFQGINFDNKFDKLNQLSTNFETFLSKFDQKHSALLSVIDQKVINNQGKELIYRVIDTYVISDSDNNEVDYTGDVYHPYNNNSGNFEDLKNSTLTTIVALNNVDGCIIINKCGTFSELILGGNNGSGGWRTSYWNYCSMVFYNGYEIVAVYRLEQGNSDDSKWNSIKLGFQMTKLAISGYCSFSKISFKK